MPWKPTFGINLECMYNFGLNRKVEELLKHIYEPLNMSSNTELLWLKLRLPFL